MRNRQLINGFGAVIAIAIIVLVVPALLLALAGNPIPGSLEEIGLILTAPDLGGAFLMGTVLPCLAWAIWVYVVWCLIAETVALARHGRSALQSRPHRGPGRRLASTLVTAVALMIGGTAVVGPAYAAEAPDAHAVTQSFHADTTAALNVQPDDAVGAVVSANAPTGFAAPETASLEAASPDASASDAAIRVQEGDSLWSLAETHLGDGNRYPEIVERNLGVMQADGHALTHDLWLTPGWVLSLPIEAAPSTDSSAPATGDGARASTSPELDDEVIVVEDGDTLWELAETHLGNGAAYDLLAQASSITDPALIRPGDAIVIPAAGDDAVSPSNPEEPTGEGEAADTTDQDEVDTGGVDDQDADPVKDPDPAQDPAPDPDPVPDEASTVPAHPVELTETAHAGAESPTTFASSGDQASAEVDIEADRLDLRTIGGIGGALAAGLLGWVGVRRALQRRSRLPGERIAMPEDTAHAFETELRSVDATEAVLRVDHVFRYIAALAQDTDATMPRILIARADATHITLYLAHAAPAPAPFDQIDETDSSWRIHAAQIPHLDREPSFPCPALVSLGSDASGALLFMNLEEVPMLGLDGDPDLVRDALLALALDLATSRWGEDVRLTLAGFDESLDEALATERIRHVSDLDALETELHTHARQVRAALDALDEPTLTSVRTRSPDAESWPSDVVLAAAERTDPALDGLIGLVTDPSSTGLCLIVPALDAPWRLTLHTHEAATLDLPGGAGRLELTPQLLVPTEYEHLIEIARVTGNAPMPSSIRPGDESDWTISLDPAPGASPLLEGAPDHIEAGHIESEHVPAAEATWEVAESRPGPVETTEPTENTETIATPAPPGSEAAVDSVPESQEHTDLPLLTAPSTAEGSSSPEIDGPLRHTIAELAPAIEDARRVLAQPIGLRTPGGRLRRRRGADADGRDRLDEDARALVQSLGAGPWVRLLGPVELFEAAGPLPVNVQTGEPNTSTMKRATELVAYLTLHPGATTEEFHAAFWPGKDPRGKTAASNRNGLATRARKWLGSDADGLPYFPHVGSAGYRLDSRITSDWHVFLALIGDDFAETPTARLRAALDLVHGPPFSGVKDRFYGWAEITRMDMLATIGDACHEFASRALQAGDVGAARTSAALGRDIDPVNEIAWRDALQAELLAGDQQGFDRIVTLLQQQLDDFEDGYEPEPETQELIDRGRGIRRPEPLVVRS